MSALGCTLTRWISVAEPMAWRNARMAQSDPSIGTSTLVMASLRLQVRCVQPTPTPAGAAMLE